MSMNFIKKTQIKAQDKTYVIAILFNRIFTILLVKYFDYSNIFPKKNSTKFLEYIRINDYFIKLKKDKQLFFRPIYSLKPVELKILKIYIKINLVNNFIQLFKFFSRVFIFFN